MWILLLSILVAAVDGAPQVLLLSDASSASAFLPQSQFISLIPGQQASRTTSSYGGQQFVLSSSQPQFLRLVQSQPQVVQFVEVPAASTSQQDEVVIEARDETAEEDPQPSAQFSISSLPTQVIRAGSSSSSYRAPDSTDREEEVVVESREDGDEVVVEPLIDLEDYDEGEEDEEPVRTSANSGQQATYYVVQQPGRSQPTEQVILVQQPVARASTPILRYSADAVGSLGFERGFDYAFEAADGASQSASGTFRGGAVVQRGQYRYTDPATGKEYAVKWIADERGFRPQGAHFFHSPEMVAAGRRHVSDRAEAGKK